MKTMIRSRSWAAAAALSACLVPGAWAAVPAGFTYQGNLWENNVPVNASKSMLFRVTDANGSTVYWSTGPLIVPVRRGHFSVDLRPPVAWGAVAPFIEVTVEGEVLLPRERLSAVPFAQHAATAEAAFAGTADPPGAPGMLFYRSDLGRLRLFNGSWQDLAVGGESPWFKSGNDAYILSGKVGIGTASPQYPLHVTAGAARVEGDIQSAGSVLAAGGLGAGFRDLSLTGAGYSFGGGGLTLETGGAERVRLDASGRLGVGTAAPQSLVHVHNGDLRLTGTSGIYFSDGSFLSSAGSGSAVSISNPGDAIVTGDADANGGGGVFLRTGSNNRVVINNAGNVGIGTAAPAQRLDVSGTVKATAFLGDGSGLAGVAASGLSTGTYAARYAFTHEGSTFTAARFESAPGRPLAVAVAPGPGAGGALTVSAGSAGVAGGGAGGDLTLQAGSHLPQGGSGYSNLGPSGKVTVKAGDGFNAVGGDVLIRSGTNTNWAVPVNGFSKVTIEGGELMGGDGARLVVEGAHNGSSSNAAMAYGGNAVLSGGSGIGGLPGGHIALLPGAGSPAGGVGIGTAAPADRLHVVGGNINAGGGRVVNVGVPTGAGDAATKSYVDGLLGGGGGPLTFSSPVTASSGMAVTAGELSVSVAGDATARIASNGLRAQLIISSGAAFSGWGLEAAGTGGNGPAGSFNVVERGAGTRLTVLKGGKVGIGTTAPVTKLHVNGDISLPSNEDLTWGGAFGPGVPTLSGETGNGLFVYPGGSSSGATFRIDAGGKVGIGVGVPSARLELNDADSNSTTSGMKFTNFSCSSNEKLWVDAAGNVVCAPDAGSGVGGNIVDSLYDTLGAGSDAGGRSARNLGGVSIGTTNPTGLLEVSGPYPQARLNNPASGAGVEVQLLDGGVLRQKIGNLTSAGYLQFGTGGTESLPVATRMTIDNAGRVGIGTTDPASLLQVANGDIQLDDSRGLFYAQCYGDGTTLQADGPDTLLQACNAGSIRFNRTYPSAAEWMRIDSDGELGLGTSDPQEKLDVVGSIRARGSVAGGMRMVMQDTSASPRSWEWYPRLSGADSFGLYERVGGKVSLLVSSAAKVGVGSGDVPEASLHVRAADAAPLLALQRSGSRWSFDTSGPLSVREDTGQSQAGAGPARLHIAAGGNVGIGTAAPGQKLTVTGTVESTAGGFKFPDGSVQASAAASSQWGTSGSDIFFSGGRVGLGTSAPADRLHLKSGNNGEDVVQAFDGWANAERGLRIRTHTGGASALRWKVGSPFYAAGETGGEAGTDFAIERFNTSGGSLGSALFIRRSDGNVGVAATDPQARLHVLGLNAAANSAIFDSPAGQSQIELRSLDTTDQPNGISFLSWSPSQSGMRQKGVFRMATGGHFVWMLTNDGAASATERMRLQADGKLGIGTLAPAAPLHVQAPTPRLLVSTGTGAAFAGDLYVGGGFPTFSGKTSRLQLRADFGGAAQADRLPLSLSGNGIEFAPLGAQGGSPTMVLDNSGRLGIGMTSPQHALHVAGTARFDGGDFLRFNADAPAGQKAWRQFVDSSSWYLATLADDLTGENLFLRFTRSGTSLATAAFLQGNVGVGTGSPGARLEVNDSDGNIATSGLKFTNFACAGTDKLTVGANGLVVCAPDASGSGSGNVVDTLFDTLGAGNDAGGRSLLNTGSVGVGTAAPASPLHVRSAAATPARFENTAAEAQVLIKGTGQGTDANVKFVRSEAGHLRLGRYNDAESSSQVQLSIDNGGNVVVGAAVPSPGMKLDVRGNSWIQGGSLYMAYDPNTYGFVQTDPQGNLNLTGSLALGKHVLLSPFGGNVGVGTAAPEDRLHVAGSVRASEGSSTSSAQPELRLYRSNGAGAVGASFALGGLAFKGHRGDATVATGASIEALNPSGPWSAANTPADIVIKTTGFGATVPSERMRVTAYGTVGIGGYSAVDKLTVAGTISSTAGGFKFPDGTVQTTSASGGVSGTAGRLARFTSASAVGDSALQESNGNVGLGAASAGARLELNGPQWLMRLSDADDYTNRLDLHLIDSPVKQLRLNEGFGDGNLMTWNLDGRVGVGTTEPGYKLDVAGQANAAQLCIAGDCKTAWPTGGGGQWTTAGADLNYVTGNVGIGVASPATRLHIKSNADPLTVDRDNAPAAITTYFLAKRQGAFKWVLGSDASDNFALFNGGGQQRLLVNMVSGNVGIGAANPASMLEVAGTARLRGAPGTAGLQVDSLGQVGIGTVSGPASMLDVQGTAQLRGSAGGTGLYVNPSGNVGIGTATPGARLDVAGGVNLKSDGVNTGELKVSYSASSPAGYYAVYAP